MTRMSHYLNLLPSLAEFFPPTPKALHLLQSLFRCFPLVTVIQWLWESIPMGRTSSLSSSMFNLPGRWGWSCAESVGPINLIYILYSLPHKLHPLASTTTSISPRTGLFGTGLPITHEILGLLYVIHYINRAGITPLLKAPSMSRIHILVSACMAIFQFVNSASLAGWICYNAQHQVSTLSSKEIDARLISPLSIIGMILFIGGLASNITAEWHLFDLRVGAAKRKARSEGKATVTYDKVYVVPEAKGLFKYVMFPHYSLEWLEWTGYWILGGAWGLGWGWYNSAAFLFLINEFFTMTPRAYIGVGWYEKKFGKRAVAGRKAVIPGIL